MKEPTVKQLIFLVFFPFLYIILSVAAYYMILSLYAAAKNDPHNIAYREMVAGISKVASILFLYSPYLAGDIIKSIVIGPLLVFLYKAVFDK